MYFSSLEFWFKPFFYIFYFTLMMLMFSSAFLNIWNIFIIAILMSLSAIHYIISGSVPTDWFLFCFFEWQVVFHWKSAIWMLCCWAVEFYLYIYMYIYTFKYLEISVRDTVKVTWKQFDPFKACFSALLCGSRTTTLEMGLNWSGYWGNFLLRALYPVCGEVFLLQPVWTPTTLPSFA